MSEVFAAMAYFAFALLLIEVIARKMEGFVSIKIDYSKGPHQLQNTVPGPTIQDHTDFLAGRVYAAPANVAGADPNADVASQPLHSIYDGSSLVNSHMNAPQLEFDELIAFEKWFYSDEAHAEWSCVSPPYALAWKAWKAARRAV